MLEEGYAAVTSRRVAARAGLKPQLVHYYFRTMDDLFVALWRRRAEQGLRRQAEALESDQPLWALWEFSRDPQDRGLTLEFIALANHRKVIRAEITATAERSRAEQVDALSQILERYRVPVSECPPIVAFMLIHSVSQVLVIEEAFELSEGHAEAVAFVERLIRQFEGERRQVPDEVPIGG